MRFKTKAFLLPFSTSLVCSLALCATIYTTLTSSLREQFNQNYRSQVKLIGDTLSQLEVAADLIALNAAKALSTLENKKGLPSDKDLIQLASSLNVAHIFVTDQSGRFIRSTNGSVKDFKNGLFDYCAGYRNLIEGDTPFEQTPIIPSTDEASPGPFKYTMIPNGERTRVLEVSVPLEFIRSTLSKAIKADKNIIELGLYTPNGTPLGYVSQTENKVLPPIDKTKSHLPNLNDLPQDAQFITEIRTQTANCCECDTKSLSASGTPYHYILSAKVSTRALNQSIVKSRNLIATLFLAAITIAFYLSRRLSRMLLARLDLISAGLREITKEGNLERRLAIPGQDELASLGQQIDQMSQSLQENQRNLVELEKAKAYAEVASQVAHDIRSPIAALQVIETDLKSLPSDSYELFKSALFRVKEIADDLLIKYRESNKGTGAKSVQNIDLLLDEVLREQSVKIRNSNRIKIQRLRAEGQSDNHAMLDPADFKRTVSNLINNAIDAIPDQGKVIIETSRASATQISIAIRDTGRGIPQDILPSLGERGTTFGKPEGTGLGLYAAKKSAKDWGGDLRISSEIGHGTEVTIDLPWSPIAGSSTHTRPSPTSPI